MRSELYVIGSIVTDSTGSGTHTTCDIVGEIQRLYLGYGDTTNTGSISITESGTNKAILFKKGFAATLDLNPRDVICSSGGTVAAIQASGGNYWTPFRVSAPLTVNITGGGNAKKTGNLHIYYLSV